MSKTVIPIVAAPAAIEAAQRIHPRATRGRFARWRWALVWATQAVFYGLPWLSWQGRQAVWFNLEGRRFHFFGSVLLPQDLVLLTGVLVFSALLLFAATALFGRVWCGFACPQTVYTELFMWLEHRLEGDRLARLRLDAAPWRADKLLRRGGKHLAWAALALATGFSLVGWFTPIRQLAAALPSLALGGWEVFWILFYAAATYVHAGLLREKLCQHACPYGRFQGAMLEPATRVVAYDHTRGEPRGARPRGVAARAVGQGDCVDCQWCVQVCPVGIDIRQGLQAACISCGLCIDACNSVMDKLQAPRGLIRFRAMAAAPAPAPAQAQAPDQAQTAPASAHGHPPAQPSAQPSAPAPARQWAARPRAGWRQRPRVLAYGLGLLLVGGATVAGAWQRPDLRLNVLRDRATLARVADDGAVENVYRLQLMNARTTARRLRVQAWLDGPTPRPLVVEPDAAFTLAAAEDATHTVRLRLPAEAVAEIRTLAGTDAGTGTGTGSGTGTGPRPTQALPLRIALRAAEDPASASRSASAPTSAQAPQAVQAQAPSTFWLPAGPH